MLWCNLQNQSAVMTILVFGINHKTAPVALREKVAFSEEKCRDALHDLQEQKLAESAVILSTCNRTEIYLQTQNQDEIDVRIYLQWLSKIHNLSAQELEKYLYLEQENQAIQHLMRVCCGLDSLILGEPQILGQVKQAYQQSIDFYAQENQQTQLSPELDRLFQKSFAVAKRVRTETQIGSSAVSVAYAACSLAKQIFDKLKKQTVLLVGAGETIELVARHLLANEVQHLIIANRTLQRAEALKAKLATQANIDIISLDALPKAIDRADIIIASTASPNILITQQMLKDAQKQRRYQPTLVVDIAVPRDIEESVDELEFVYYYNVDDLENIIQHNQLERQKSAIEAEKIIQEEVEEFAQWQKVHQFSQLIANYRQSAVSIRRDLLEKASQSLANHEDPEKLLQEITYKLMNKLLHAPTQVMQAMVKSGNLQGLENFAEQIKQTKS